MAESETMELTRSWHEDLRDEEQQRRLKNDGLMRRAKVEVRAGAGRAENDAEDIEEEDLEDVLASAEHVMNHFFEE
jgi:hypothetical protein